MNTLDPNLDDIPKEIVDAAILISEWMAKNGHEDWALMDIQKRVYPDSLTSRCGDALYHDMLKRLHEKYVYSLDQHIPALRYKE